MAIREILIYPQHKEALRKDSKPVSGINRQTRRLIKDLKDTLRAHSEGVGLAAPQINEHLRVIIVRLGAKADDEKQPGPMIALINPQIQVADDERKDFDGCLSFPGLFGETKRPHRLRITGLDENGIPFDQVFEGFDAVVVHHEIDHLNGVLFIDRIEQIEDLYRVRENEDGELVRVPISLEV